MSAIISGDGLFRYSLGRIVALRDRAADPKVLVYLMLNPSIADASKDDHTIRKCIGFAERFGYDEIRVVNLYAFRATKPADLVARIKQGLDAVGPENDAHIERETYGRQVVCAWGSIDVPGIKARVDRVLSLCCTAASLACLGKSKSGSPLHPLTLPYENKLQPFG